MANEKNTLADLFNKEYNNLNAAQKMAVDNIEGPVMVIAGPGTGKTQILASRIGKILLETDAYPENILCLTFTDAGVVAMRKRLLKFIGPDAYKINIYTYHAFCNDIIQENLLLFEKSALDPISDLEKIELYKNLIDTLPKNHPLKRYRGDVYFEIENLQSLFSNMKKEGWTPDYLYQRIDDYVKTLPENKDYIYQITRKGQFEKGEFKPGYYDEIERMEKLKAAINEFPRFQKMMRDRGRYDFEDMINWVIKAFEENKNLLATYQEKYHYLLVDEYQDTSGTQNKLIQLLINFWDKPNIFVVGDDDQSIFRFQGANVENMLHFANQYQNDLLKIVLTNNYRSTQPILNTSKVLIAKNDDRLIKKIEGLSKDLIASKEEIKHHTQSPFLLEYDTERNEMIGTVKKVQELLENKVPPGNIGIIYRENKYGEEIARYFNLLNIPVYTKRNVNAFDLPLTKKLFSILRYLEAEHYIPYSGDELLFEILHFDWFNIAPIEIAKISIEVANRKFKENKTSIRELLIEKRNNPPKDLFASPLNQQLAAASHVIEKLIGETANQTLQGLFDLIIREAGVLKAIMQGTEKHWELEILTTLFDFIKDETHRNPNIQIHELVGLINLMQEEKIPIPLVKISGSEKGINLMTAHGSKGLEFEYIFIVGANASIWEKKRPGNKGFKLPPNIFSTTSKESDLQELRRLFYVAITRAETHLYISYSKFSNNGKELEPSMFLAEINEEMALDTEIVVLDNEVVWEFTALGFSKGMAPEINKMEEDIITPILDKFVMNVTALNSYLKCPLGFYFNNFIRIPSAKNEASEFGSAVHYSLQVFFDKMIRDDHKQFPSKEALIDAFKWYMERQKEGFSKEQFSRRLEYGQEVLSNYYDTYIHTFNKIVLIEYPIKNVLINNIPLKGKLDKLEFDGTSVNVVDYKSGDPEKGLKKTNSPNQKDLNGGDYWRQAVFYKILVDNKQDKNWVAISTEFDFVEPDSKKKYKKHKIVVTPQDIEMVTQQINTVWEKIQKRDFYTGCGKEECHWCNFVKTNNLAIALHEQETEE